MLGCVRGVVKEGCGELPAALIVGGGGDGFVGDAPFVGELRHDCRGNGDIREARRAYFGDGPVLVDGRSGKLEVFGKLMGKEVLVAGEETVCEALGIEALVLFEGEGEADAEVTHGIEGAYGVTHVDEGVAVVGVENGLAEGRSAEQLLLPVRGILVPCGCDADVYGVDEARSDELDVVVRFGGLLLKLVNGIQEDGGR